MNYTGSGFARRFLGEQFYKIFRNESDYIEGINSSQEGIKFESRSSVLKHIIWGGFICKVSIPTDAVVTVDFDHYKFKSDRLILHTCYSFGDFLAHNLSFVLDAIKAYSSCEKIWPNLHERIRLDSLRSEYESIIELLPNEIDLEEIYLESLDTTNKYMLEIMPDNHKTKAICEKAFSKSAHAIEHIPDRLKTPEMCMNAVKEYGGLLKYVPHDMITREMCITSVIKCGSYLEHVPENLKSRKLCLIATQNNQSALKFVPERLKNKQMCWNAVKCFGSLLEYVPRRYKSSNLCLLAVSNCGMAFSYVPDEIITWKIFRAQSFYDHTDYAHCKPKIDKCERVRSEKFETRPRKKRASLDDSETLNALSDVVNMMQ